MLLNYIDYDWFKLIMLYNTLNQAKVTLQLLSDTQNGTH